MQRPSLRLFLCPLQQPDTLGTGRALRGPGRRSCKQQVLRPLWPQLLLALQQQYCWRRLLLLLGLQPLLQ